MSIKSLSIVLIATLMFASCDRDKITTQPNNTTPTNGDITMNVNGYAWAAPRGYASKTGTAVLTLSGQANQNNYITITVSPYNGISTYPVNGITKISYFEDNIEYQTIKGQIAITAEDDYHIAGNFSGDLVSNSGSTTLSFTNGLFDIDK